MENIKKGFTLSEVLIALVIIGVIAAAAIPVFTNNVNNKLFVASLQKIYSTLNEMGQKITMDNHGTLKGIFVSGNPSPGMPYNISLFKPYFNIVKTCELGTVEGNCWSKRDGWKQFDGSPVNYVDPANFYANSAGFVLADGTLFFVSGAIAGNMGYDDCTGSWIDYLMPGCTGGQNETGAPNACISMMVDTNGFKGPNQIGKDIHSLHYDENGEIIIPQGCNANIGFDKTQSMLLGTN